MRSNRFKTFRLAAMVLAPLKLRCCDIKKGFRLKTSCKGKRPARFFNPSRYLSSRRELQLVAQNDAAATGDKLMVNVEALG